MSHVTFDNRFDAVRAARRAKNRRGLHSAGQTLLRGAGPRTPRKTGRLRRMTALRQLGERAVAVKWAAGYAAVQQVGKRRGARPFRNYTTSGTGAGFVQVGVSYLRSRYRELFR